MALHVEILCAIMVLPLLTRRDATIWSLYSSRLNQGDKDYEVF